MIYTLFCNAYIYYTIKKINVGHLYLNKLLKLRFLKKYNLSNKRIKFMYLYIATQYLVMYIYFSLGKNKIFRSF